MKKHGKSIGCLLLLALLLCGCRASSPSQEGAEIAEEATLEDIERVVTEEMDSLLGANPGIYTIDGIAYAGDTPLAVVHCQPGMGQGSVYLMILGTEEGRLRVADRLDDPIPLSLGIAVYTADLPGHTVIFGAVGDQVWTDPEETPRKVDFTQVEACCADGSTHAVAVSNNHAYLLCLDGGTEIGNVLFYSGDEVAVRYSGLPIGEKMGEETNTAVLHFVGEARIDDELQPFEASFFGISRRKGRLTLRVLGDVLDYELRNGWMPETIEAPRTADINGDGSDDILVDLGIYGKIRFVVCYLYDAETGSYRMLEGFDELENPRFDEVRGCVFDWCHLSAPEYVIHRYVVEGDRLKEVGSLYWNYSIVPGGPRYTERELRDGEMVFVKEGVPESEIDLSDWQ